MFYQKSFVLLAITAVFLCSCSTQKSDQQFLDDYHLLLKMKEFDQMDFNHEIRQLQEEIKRCPDLMAIIEGKQLYESKQDEKAKEKFTSVKPDSFFFEEMVHTLLWTAKGQKDLEGIKLASHLFMETNLRNNYDWDTYHWPALELCDDWYLKDKENLIFSDVELFKWRYKHGYHYFEELINYAETKKNGPYIKQVKEMLKHHVEDFKIADEFRWCDLYDRKYEKLFQYFRSMMVLEKYEECLNEININGYYFYKTDLVYKDFYEERYKSEQADKMTQYNGFLPLIRYIKGRCNLGLHNELWEQGKKEEARDLLIGRKGAAAQFALLEVKSPYSSLVPKAKEYYEECRKLSKIRYQKNLIELTKEKIAEYREKIKQEEISK